MAAAVVVLCWTGLVEAFMMAMPSLISRCLVAMVLRMAGTIFLLLGAFHDAKIFGDTATRGTAVDAGAVGRFKSVSGSVNLRACQGREAVIRDSVALESTAAALASSDVGDQTLKAHPELQSGQLSVTVSVLRGERVGLQGLRLFLNCIRQKCAAYVPTRAQQTRQPHTTMSKATNMKL